MSRCYDVGISKKDKYQYSLRKQDLYQYSLSKKDKYSYELETICYVSKVHNELSSGGLLLAGNAIDNVDIIEQNDYPAVENSVFWYNSQENIFQDIAGTVPAGIGQRVGCWKSVWGDDTPAVAIDDNDHYKPIIQGGLQNDVGNTILTLPSRLNISGDYTLYFVSSRTDSDQFIMPMGQNDQYTSDYGDTTGGCWSDRNFYAGFEQSYAFFPAEYTTEKCIRRVRRVYFHSEEFESLTDNYYLKVPNAAEYGTTNARGTIKIDCLLGRVGQYPAYTDSFARIHQIVFVARNIEPGSTDDLNIIAKLQELEPDAAW